MTPDPIPPVLIADDGELDDVRRLLDELEIDFVEPTGTGPFQTTLLITNPRHALAREKAISFAASCRFHLVVADKDLPKTLRREIQRVELDFLVQRPVDPTTMRLVILHALYSGPEKRQSLRVTLGAAVKFRTGVVSRAGTLIELSQRGCRLTTGYALGCGQTLTVMLPREVTGTGRLAVKGCVVSEDPRVGGEPLERGYCIAFRGLDTTAKGTLRAVMLKHTAASGALRPGTDAEPPTGTGAVVVPAPRRESEAASSGATVAPAPRREGEAASSDASSERRSAARQSYKRSVLAAANGATQVLIGRDLSKGGMRVEPHPSLVVGDELKLVIYGSSRRQPLAAKVLVARDDGEDGCVLHFKDLSPQASAKLEKLMASLPSLRSTHPDARANVVAAEIVEES